MNLSKERVAMLPECRVVRFVDHEEDHGGEHIAPLGRGGFPFLWSAADDWARQTLYSMSADGILSLLIENYVPRGLEETPVNAEEGDRVEQRTEYMHNQIKNMVLQVIMAGLLPPEAEAILRRTVELDPPLTADEVASWDYEVPLVLLGAFYDPKCAEIRGKELLVAPAGNVILVDVFNPEQFLDCLNEMGVVRVARYHGSMVNQRVLVELSDQPAAEVLAGLLERAIAVASISGEADHFVSLRMQLDRIAAANLDEDLTTATRHDQIDDGPDLIQHATTVKDSLAVHLARHGKERPEVDEVEIEPSEQGLHPAGDHHHDHDDHGHGHGGDSDEQGGR